MNEPIKTCSCNQREYYPAKASFNARGFDHIVTFTPGFVCERFLADPSDEGNHGKSCAEVLFLVRNKEGAIQFTVLTGWYPDWQEDKYAQRGKGYYPLPADLGYHSPKPHYKGQKTITGECVWLGNKRCYYDGSTLNAEQPFNILITKGETALWKFLEQYHKNTFKRTQ